MMERLISVYTDNRESHKKWKRRVDYGIRRYLGKCSAFDAELWEILHGLALIHNEHYDGVLIQINSLEVVKAIQKHELPAKGGATVWGGGSIGVAVKRLNLKPCVVGVCY
ncbi:hypothetical protein Godav_020598 [Gossypium davidsonii]|uniref:RNase H type-1 domain-containing protein n=1 Tax=Gossypium davidsonii TaxID=34287 RepID=A0A7J8R3D9_GOSDV|nr:hypothetical protein [Gossypium davidsonii]